MAASECAPLDFGCTAGEWASSVVGDAIQNMADAVLEGVGKAVASLGTLWVNVGTPNLTGNGTCLHRMLQLSFLALISPTNLAEPTEAVRCPFRRSSASTDMLQVSSSPE